MRVHVGDEVLQLLLAMKRFPVCRVSKMAVGLGFFNLSDPPGRPASGARRKDMTCC